MLVGIFEKLARGVVAGRDFMDVNVDRNQAAVDSSDEEMPNARLLLRFANRHIDGIPLAIGMTAQLQPLVELAVMSQQAPAAIGRQDPRRSCDVPWSTGPFEAIGVIPDQPTNPRSDVCLSGKLGDVRVEHVE